MESSHCASSSRTWAVNEVNPNSRLSLRQTLTTRGVPRRAVLLDQLWTHAELISDVGGHWHWHRVGRTKWPTGVSQQSELYRVTEAIVIPAMSANAVQIIIRKRVVAGNLPPSHIEVRIMEL